MTLEVKKQNCVTDLLKKMIRQLIKKNFEGQKEFMQLKNYQECCKKFSMNFK